MCIQNRRALKIIPRRELAKMFADPYFNVRTKKENYERQAGLRKWSRIFVSRLR